MWDLSLWESYPIQDTLNLKLAKITEIKENLSAFRAVMSSQTRAESDSGKNEDYQVWSESESGKKRNFSSVV